MLEHTHLWSIVLAAGDGIRLSQLATDGEGQPVPKQFCSFNSNRSLLAHAISRARCLTPESRTLVVVAADHRRWWQRGLADIPPSNIIVQPCNRGTACGVLLPLMTVLSRDPDATVLVTPSDHFVQDEEVLIRAMQRAAISAQHQHRELVLLGMQPESPETSYGWITPSPSQEDGLYQATTFVEKPDQPTAHQLIQAGSLWNSFIFAAPAIRLLDHFRATLPEITSLFTLCAVPRNATTGGGSLRWLYDRVPASDFSRHVLEAARATGLRVLPVPPCGWTDLGTPERVAACAERIRCPLLDPPDVPRRRTGPIDLAQVVATF